MLGYFFEFSVILLRSHCFDKRAPVVFRSKFSNPLSVCTGKPGSFHFLVDLKCLRLFLCLNLKKKILSVFVRPLFCRLHWSVLVHLEVCDRLSPPPDDPDRSGGDNVFPPAMFCTFMGGRIYIFPQSGICLS